MANGGGGENGLNGEAPNTVAGGNRVIVALGEIRRTESEMEPKIEEHTDDGSSRVVRRVKTVHDEYPTLDCLAVVESKDDFKSGTTVESNGVSRLSTALELSSAQYNWEKKLCELESYVAPAATEGAAAEPAVAGGSGAPVESRTRVKAWQWWVLTLSMPLGLLACWSAALNAKGS